MGAWTVTIIRDGTTVFATSLEDVAITLEPLATIAVLGVTLDLGDDVQIGGGSVISTATGLAAFQTIVIEATGAVTLESTGTINFAAAPLTLELAAGAVFTDDGTFTGSDLTIEPASGAGTLVNNAVIAASGPLDVAAGVTIGGAGSIEIGGAGASTTIDGSVGSGQTLLFTDGSTGQTLTVGSSAAISGTIDLRANQTIDLSGLTYSSISGDAVTFSNGTTLHFAPAAGQTLDTPFQQATNQVVITAAAVGADSACYCAGTRIATEGGEAPVEMLRPGDRLRLARGGIAAVRWVGQRIVDCERHTEPRNVWPVRILAGAFGEAVPHRDLLLSPDHAVAYAGHLIPVRHLTNGATVRQERVAVAHYHHVELPTHDLLLAEGLAAESYLDTGNRAMFSNGGGAVALYPEFSRRVWAASGCLPLVEHGPVVVAARRALLRRAIALGHRRTRDAAVRVTADGRGVRKVPHPDGWFIPIPEGTSSVRLRSRSWVPAEMRANADDRRRLGVAVCRLWLDRREVSLDSRALSAGWYAPEAHGRWTDGDAELGVAGARSLCFALTLTGIYWRGDRWASAALRA
jgi:hypothetical protein